MGSWIKCTCGASINRNLFSGGAVSLVVSEDFFETDFGGTSGSEVIAKLLHEADKMVRCKTCGRMHLIGGSSDRNFESITPDGD